MMQALRLKSILVPSLSPDYGYGLSKSLISRIAAYSTSALNKPVPPKPNGGNSILADYLVSSLMFSKDRALSVTSKFSSHRTLEKPEKVVHFFRGHGFSESHIRSLVHGEPHVLFADVEKTLKPKVDFFLELGLSGPPLALFISRNPLLMRCSLDRCLKPRICLLMKIHASNGRNRSIQNVNDDVCRTITRHARFLFSGGRFQANIRYLESVGVVGSQLSSLLLRQPRIFGVQQNKLAKVFSKALDMNFTVGSQMLVHGIHTLSSMTPETLNGKVEVFKVFGFSKEEVDSMFRKSPHIFRLSVKTLRRKLALFLDNLKVDRLVVVQFPGILSLSTEERVIPRYKVLEILKLKCLLKKDPSLRTTMVMSESRFFHTYILPFKADTEELLLAYKGHFLNTSTK